MTKANGENSQRKRLAERFTELEVYKVAFELQQDIFKATKNWPKEEMYALTDQVRRSSRSVGANIAEAWGKRRYEAHFASKLTDADAEAQETIHWLRTAYACEYISRETCQDHIDRAKSIGKMLGSMMASASSFQLSPKKPRA
ncbi:four helix bundle protein [Roseimicrobium sp. ORNL1]|uniref:four helix bundle protein n=1 Tax=Roseimicrobium sp. ORNL1 TaxID=2711231 RepID=UPI0013E0F3B0|nr:four helix bundle protein [Roseimicrobium sp. ORNL1]QIF01693.1 four helix bundle protein [Roseimicrobium sp. ORNL1]